MCIFINPKPQFELFVSICKICKFISFFLKNPHRIECVGTKGKVAATALLQYFERVLSGKKMLETQAIYNNPCLQSMILSERTPEGTIQK